MRVFISWSGEQSRKVGEALAGWLPKVLQATTPWISSRDLAAGKPWAEELMRELATVRIGIFCITPTNVEAPWLAFEAAACMAKTEGRVFTFLHGVDYPDVKGPLSVFQHLKADEQGVLKLLENLNREAPKALAAGDLKEVFEAWWPKLRDTLVAIKAEPAKEAPKHRPDGEVLREVLEAVRGMQGEMARQREVAPHLELRVPVGGLGFDRDADTARRALILKLNEELESFGVKDSLDLARALASGHLGAAKNVDFKQALEAVKEDRRLHYQIGRLFVHLHGPGSDPMKP